MPVLRVTAYLSAPLAAAQPVELDGLCLERACRLTGEPPISRATPVEDLVRPTMPLARLDHDGHGVWLAGGWTLPAEARMTQESFTSRLDPGDEFYRGGKHSRRAGPEKDYCIRHPVYETPSVSWLAVGGRRNLIRMLRDVSALGRYRRHGWGTVTRWEIEPVDVDPWHVLVSGGKAVRHLPASWCEWYDHAESGAVEPPYWHAGRHVQRVPTGTRCEVLPAVMERASRCS